MKKRVLWLLNHTTLRNFEVPMLIELGFEVFTPKIYSHEFGDLSVSVTWEYDSSLSLPRKELELLNATDFYSGRLSDDVMEIMNKRFDIAIFTAFVQQVKWLTLSFKGLLLFRAFGLDKTMTYTKVFANESISLFDRIRACGDRFWFCASYENLAEVECDFFKRRNVYLPIGLKVDHISKSWIGGDKRFLFVGPQIMTNSYYHDVYKNFKKDFGDLPHVIGGSQLIPVKNDRTVVGFLPKEEYEYNMTHLAGMYYHSQEPRHLHYHPLEAIANGMPLIYMAGGMLDELGGENLPGNCKSVHEARTKLKRLARGDKRFIRAVVNSQDVLLKPFTYAYCREKWEDALAKMLKRPCRAKNTKQRKKIAVILPLAYLGGVLDYTIRLVKCLVKGAEEQGDHISVVLGYPNDPVYEEKDYFKDLKNLGVSLRTFSWNEKPADWTQRAFRLMDVPNDYAEDCANACYVMNDGMTLFEDCDYLVFTVDRLPGQLFSTRPFAVVAHDYIQRYRAEMLGPYYEYACIDSVRKADAVFTTTPATTDDAIQYAGVKKENVILTPLMFDLLPAPEEPEEEPSRELRKEFFLWSTNIAPHKNHKKALHALSDYYYKGGKLRCIITGVNTEQFNVKKSEKQLGMEINLYVKEIRKIINEDEVLKRNLVVKGNLPKVQYIRILQKAKFVFHPGYADNGNGTAIDGATLGVPTVCSDYPAMRYISDYTGIHAHFFDPFDADSICEALWNAQAKYEEYAAQVPSRDALERFTVEGTYHEIYQIIRRLVGGLV